MRLVFCGTPQFAVPTLEALVSAGHNVALVLSQPDRPVGRNADVQPTPVKRAALAHGIPVEQPEKIHNNEPLRAALQAIAPDAIIVVAYGRILPQWMLALPLHGCINGHASLLPRWRGAAPIQWAVASGDTETGVTTMRLDAGLDTGAMLLRRSVPIGLETTSPELFVSLAAMGAELMVQTLERLGSGTLAATRQDDSQVTLAPILKREDGLIDWSRPAAEIHQRFRGFQPWPGAFTTLRGKKLIVHAMTYTPLVCSFGEAGAIDVDAGLFRITCGQGSVVQLDEVQLEGKKRMSATEFLRGFQIRSVERLG